MKFVLTEKGTYRLEDTEKPVIRGKENLIRVKACGICGSDLPRVFDGKVYHFPLVIGHEFSGVIEDSYDKTKIGRRVCVFPIKPCFSCDCCRAENYANCAGYDYFGSRCDGGMQDYVVCDDFNLVYLDDAISYRAAAMIEPCAVCLHAVKRADLSPSSVLRIYGAGTIGLLCAMWARAAGVTAITVTDVDEKKAAFARTLGFATDGGDAPDRVIDASGAPDAVRDAIDVIRPFGRIVLVGNAARDVDLPVAVYSQILRKQLTLTGSWNSDYKESENDWRETAEAIAARQIEPEKLITHVYALRDAEKAFAMIGAHKESFTKVMMEM